MNEQKDLIRAIVLKAIADTPIQTREALRQRVCDELHPTDEPEAASARLQAAVFGNSVPAPALSDGELSALSEVYWDLIIQRHLSPDLIESDLFRSHPRASV